MLKSLFRSRGNSHGNGTQATPDGAVTAESKAPEDGGRLIVLTAPLTETIDHAGYFIQMALASLPVWMEFVINDKYPTWCLQWQIIMKCWKMDLRPTFNTWWAPIAWKFGAFIVWLLKLRRTNGPNFKWPLVIFSIIVPERILALMGKIYVGKPLKTMTRRELIASLKPHYWQYLRADNGDLPEGYTPPERPAAHLSQDGQFARA